MVVQVASGEHAGMQMERMMRNIATRLGAMVRDSDAIALRSETFLILATETDRAGAIDMGKRLRKGLKDLIDHAELIIGSASYPEDAVEMYQLIGMAEESARV